MRIALILALLTINAADAAPAKAPVPPPWTRTRPLSPGAIDLITSAAERSSIIAGLLEDLEQSDIVVYLTDSMPGAVGGPTSYLVFLSRDSSARYLLVRIDQWRLSPLEKIVALGHELQHALEVAAAPEVKDAAGLARLYRRIGWEGQKDRFESAGARDTSNRVRSQLGRSKVADALRKSGPPS